MCVFLIFVKTFTHACTVIIMQATNQHGHKISKFPLSFNPHPPSHHQNDCHAVAYLIPSAMSGSCIAIYTLYMNTKILT